MDENRAVVLLSGGPDSTVAMYDFHAKGLHLEALTVLSNARGANQEEVSRAERMAARIGVPQTTIDLSFLSQLYEKDPHLKFAIGGAWTCLPSGYEVAPLSVELMHMAAAMFALSRGIGQVIWGVHRGDLNGIGTSEVVAYLDKLEEVVRFRHKVFRILTPFLSLDKIDVLRRGLELGVPLEETFSCFSGDETACGECYKCKERTAAFGAFGLTHRAELASAAA